jgi:CDP-6-deoxy-D-xylo-4-hexulose-3-dehydrase
MTCIEGGIISTDNEEMYQLLRTFRSHGMLRESTNNDFKQKVLNENPSLNKDFVFVEAAHNFRSTEINAVIALNQIKRLDDNNKIRSKNLNVFLDNLNKDLYYTEFDREGNSNYAFTLLLQNKNFELRDKVEKHMVDNQIEFRRGMSGGGNQLRQPYLKKYFNEDECTKYPVTEHVHHFGWYIGNYPELSTDRILELVSILNKC